MDKNTENKNKVFICPICRHKYPVSVLEIRGAVKLSLYCRHCKTASVIDVRDDIR